MPGSAALERAYELYASVFAPALDPSVDALRARFDTMMADFPIAPGTVIEEVSAGGVPCLRVVAEAAIRDRAIVWYHSGGYVLGSARTHRSFAATLSGATNRSVILVDYRLAPEFPFPAAVDDADAALAATIDDLGAGNVSVGGDSAGGGLTVSALCRRHAAGLDQPAAAVLLSPLLDLGASGKSVEANAGKDLAVTRDGVRAIVAAYLQGQDRLHPEASPLYAEHRGLPPTLVQVGDAETLLDDSRRMAERLGAAGVEVRLSVYPEMCHAWPLFETFLFEGRQAIEEIAAFIEAHDQPLGR